MGHNIGEETENETRTSGKANQEGKRKLEWLSEFFERRGLVAEL